MDDLTNGFLNDGEGDFPLPSNIFTWDYEMIKWLAKKFQVSADDQSADPSADNQHELINIPFQLWGYTGVKTGGSDIGAGGGTLSAVFQLYIDGSSGNMITNFVDIIFADRDYNYINSRTYQLAFDKFNSFDLNFPPNAETNYFYLHFNYPETRNIYFGNSSDRNYSNALYTYDDNNNQMYNCFSNRYKTFNVEFSNSRMTEGTYLNLNPMALRKTGEVNGYPVFANVFAGNAEYGNEFLNPRGASLQVATDFTMFTIGGSSGDGLTQLNDYITNVYNVTNRQITTYQTENGDTINIYQGDNNISIADGGAGLTYDDIYNMFNGIILPFINTNQDTDIQFPTYDEIKYVDMGDFYIEPLHQYDKLPTAPTIDGTIDLGDYPRVIGASANTFLSFLPASLSALLCAVFIIAIILDNLRGRR